MEDRVCCPLSCEGTGIDDGIMVLNPRMMLAMFVQVLGKPAQIPILVNSCDSYGRSGKRINRVIVMQIDVLCV
jgi:hypothetical protein